MNLIIDWSVAHRKAMLLLLIFFITSGLAAYLSIPRESEPEVAIPLISVHMAHDGIASDDSERLLIKPMEKELKSISGVNKMTSIAGFGFATVTLEFDAGFDSDKALIDVREKVDQAKTKLPAGGEDPEVNEQSTALMPVLSIALSGTIPERQLLRIARRLVDDIEALASVLDVDIAGDREEVLEVIVDPLVLETYDIDFQTVIGMVDRNNRLVAAGAIDDQAGRMAMKVPGVVENVQDMLSLPVKAVDDRVVTFKDIATVRSTFKSPDGYSRINGHGSITLEISKRAGANIIETINEIKIIVNQHKKDWPQGLEHTYLLDKSERIESMLIDLQNNIGSAILLVMIVVIAALGFRPSLLVGFAIPMTFLTSILIIKQMDYTLNFVVLFSLILVVGMLVDGAIVVTELASRYRAEGQSNSQAFTAASKRMALPIIASTATTLAVFSPLIAWPGVIGEFIKYIPITVAICLMVSLVVALIFIPVLGSWLGTGNQSDSVDTTKVNRTSGVTLAYQHFLQKLLHYPAATLLAAFIIVGSSYTLYAFYGHGTELFPSREPETAQALLRARGNLSIQEKDQLLRTVEQHIKNTAEIESIYSRSFKRAPSQKGEDVIGILTFQFVDWSERRKVADILADMALVTQNIPGIKLEFREEDNGPTGGKPIELEVAGRNQFDIENAVDLIHDSMKQLGGFKDTEDNLPLPGIEWQLDVNREEAARYGADVSLVGSGIQLVTNGYRISEFRPNHSDEEVDIVLRFPDQLRTLDQLQNFTMATSKGVVPFSNFVSLTPVNQTGTIQRVDGRRVITVKTDVKEGYQVTERLNALLLAMESELVPSDVNITVKGEDEEQKRTVSFLSNAFMVAVFLMFLILVIQFNSLYQSLLVLSAIIFSTAGVLLGLLVTKEPFGVVMVGLGIIALAGIVVNNNIVLIDSYNDFIGQGYKPFDSALKSGVLRFRPVLLTAGTTILGLIPMVLAMNIDFFNRSISFGAPSTQLWIQLSTAIAGGLSFATVLTLFLTPCLLVLGANTGERFTRLSDQCKSSINSKIQRGY